MKSPLRVREAAVSMPEAALHFSVVFALLAPRLGVKRGLLLSALALLPDFDVFLHVHRSMSHSVILLSLVYVPVVLAFYRFGPKYFGLSMLGLLALLSHPIMDCFQTYTPILYPVVDRSFWVRVDGSVFISPNELRPQISVSVADKPAVFSAFKSMDAPVFTSEGFLISLLLVGIPLLLEVRRGRIAPADSSRLNKHGSNVSSDVQASPPDFPRASVPRDLVTVVVPTLNEEKSIGMVVDELRAEGYKRILVVDGYSSDRTVEVARSRGVEVIFQGGVGKAGAIRTAIERVSTPYMLIMDGDYTYNPKDISRLLEHAGMYDEVIGFRVNRENIPLLHRVGNWIISQTFSLLMGLRIHDPCSGMYLLRTSMARRLELTSGGFDVEVEIAGQVASLGRILEVPVSYRKRVGRGKLRAWREGLRIIAAAVRVAWLYNPVFFFSILAALLAAPGLIILLHQLTLRYLYGAEAWSVGWAWFGLILLILGLQGLTVATVSLLLKRMERRILSAQKKTPANL